MKSGLFCFFFLNTLTLQREKEMAKCLSSAWGASTLVRSSPLLHPPHRSWELSSSNWTALRNSTGFSIMEFGVLVAQSRSLCTGCGKYLLLDACMAHFSLHLGHCSNFSSSKRGALSTPTAVPLPSIPCSAAFYLLKLVVTYLFSSVYFTRIWPTCRKGLCFAP